MIFFLLTLSHYKLISLLFIIYPIISLIICCLQVIYYFLKIGAYRNSGDLIEKIDNEDTDKKGKPIKSEAPKKMALLSAERGGDRYAGYAAWRVESRRRR